MQRKKPVVNWNPSALALYFSIKETDEKETAQVFRVIYNHVCKNGKFASYLDFFVSLPLCKVLVALIALGTWSREHKEMLVPHHITSNQQAAIFMYLIDYLCLP